MAPKRVDTASARAHHDAVVDNLPEGCVSRAPTPNDVAAVVALVRGYTLAAGRAGTILHVDSNNTTPALSLYESVGMRATLVIDVWRRTVVAD